MTLRRQLPAHSPLTAFSLVAGAGGALGRDARTGLRERILRHWQASDAVLTGSGTGALRLAIEGAQRRPASLVALPAYACYDLATAANGAGSRVVLYDLDPETLAPDPASFARALAHQPDSLVLVHLFGIPVDIPGITRLCEPEGVLVIEDAAQGIGATIDERPAGSFGSVSILSFGRGKGLTGGNGGALLAHDATGEAIVKRARGSLQRAGRGLGNLARTSVQWLLSRPQLYELPASLPFLRLGETIYHKPEPTTDLSRASAGILASVWDASFAAAQVRRRNAARLLEAARRSRHWQTVSVKVGSSAGYLRFPLIVKGRPRAEVLTTAAARLGIMAGYPLPLARLPGFAKSCVNGSEEFPGAVELASRLLTLPTHSLLTERDLVALENWLAEPATS